MQQCRHFYCILCILLNGELNESFRDCDHVSAYTATFGVHARENKHDLWQYRSTTIPLTAGTYYILCINRTEELSIIRFMKLI